MSEEKRSFVFGRRHFIGAAGAAAAGLLLLRRCDPETPKGDYFDLLREAQRRLRTSPDHVPAQLERLAATGDVRGLVDYIRRHIAVLPSNPTAWVSVFNGQRWGTRGVLRSRAGTPREIVNLLAETLTNAGIEAKPVVLTQRGPTRPFLVNPEPPLFKPEKDPDDLFAWSGSQPSEPATPADSEAASRLAEAALAALDPSGFRPRETGELQSALPDVQIGTDLAGLWANADQTIPAPTGLRSPGPPQKPPTARFTLSIATTRDPMHPVDVVDATFGLDDLAGRRVDVNFVPIADRLEDLVRLRPSDVAGFVPTLRVAGLRMSEEEQSRLYAEGTPFSIEGDTFAEGDDGFTLGQGRLGDSGDPAKVETLRIKRVVSTHYPRLNVEFDALDAAGEPVENIAAEQFVFEDNSVEAPAMLRHTKAPPPSIVFILDKSLSMPAQYRDEGAQRVVTEIASEIKRRHPDARFKAAVVSTEGAAAAGWTTDPDRVGSAVRAYIGLGSALWHSYVDAAKDGADAIVFLTDGRSADKDNVAQDEPPEELASALTEAPPAIMLGTGDLGPAFQGIAEITQGTALAIEDQDEAIRAVLGQLKAYRQSYNALVLAHGESEGEDRELRLSLRGLETSAAKNYVTPPEALHRFGDGLAGIHLRVQANGITCRRTLAGMNHRSRDPLGSDIAQEVHQALFGSYSVITEAGNPSPSQILDDVFEELLSWEPVFDAETPASAIEAIQHAHDLPHAAFAF